MRRSSVSVLVCVLGLWLGACGEQSEPPQATGSSAASEPSDPTSTPPVPDGPACDEVWVDGKALPGGYRGCVDDGRWVRADATRCESGQVLVAFDDRFYGAKGAVVNDVGGPLDESKQYQGAVRSCG